MRSLFVLLTVVAAAVTLSACNIIYKLPTRQGNVIEQKQLDQLAVGMSREQVKFLMGTPIASSPFREDRWDYVGYYKSPRGKVSTRVVSLYFDKDTLARMEGVKLAAADVAADAAIENPDVKTVIREEKKAEQERSREGEKDTGVIITPQQ